MTETEIVTAKEDKAKVVAAVWGERIYSIPCRTSYFAQDDFEESDEFILFFQIILVQFIL